MVDENRKMKQSKDDEGQEIFWEEEDYMGDDDYYKQYVTHEVKLSKRKCNLCGKSFQPHTKYERFCHECKKEDELYHFYE